MLFREKEETFEHLVIKDELQDLLIFVMLREGLSASI